MAGISNSCSCCVCVFQNIACLLLYCSRANVDKRRMVGEDQLIPRYPGVYFWCQNRQTIQSSRLRGRPEVRESAAPCLSCVTLSEALSCLSTSFFICTTGMILVLSLGLCAVWHITHRRLLKAHIILKKS